MDPQASLTKAFGRNDPADRLFVSLLDRAELPVDGLSDRLTLSPSTVELAHTEHRLLAEPGREYFLRTAIERTDFLPETVVLLDCPPSLGLLSINCLAAANGLVVTVQPGGFELHALLRLDETVRVIRERVNPGLTVLGTVLTNCHARRAITGQIRDEISRIQLVLGSVRTDARLLYATTAGSILKLKRSAALEDYQQVVEQLEELLRWQTNRSAA